MDIKEIEKLSPEETKKAVISNLKTVLELIEKGEFAGEIMIVNHIKGAIHNGTVDDEIQLFKHLKQKLKNMFTEMGVI